ncbi:MAG TPA: PTS sugar transporter subunit IIA [Polyangiaceae bacterium]|nr:PTS sugar transporter subunit IIA [Polyangiaceae bacterium]
MRLCEILSVDRILVDVDGGYVKNKPEALGRLAEMLSPALGIEKSHVEALLQERERLQSTGIGDGVAIPHTAVEEATAQAAALVLCPRGIDFEAIDGEQVRIVFGVVGPKRATGEHLRTLARISRLLRDANTRSQMLSATEASSVYALIQAQDARSEVKT